MERNQQKGLKRTDVFFALFVTSPQSGFPRRLQVTTTVPVSQRTEERKMLSLVIIMTSSLLMSATIHPTGATLTVSTKRNKSATSEDGMIKLLISIIVHRSDVERSNYKSENCKLVCTNIILSFGVATDIFQ